MVSLWTILLLAFAQANCITECESSSIEACMGCLSHIKNFPSSVSGVLCNLWNYPQCNEEGIIVSSLEGSLDISYNDWKASLSLQSYRTLSSKTITIALENSTIGAQNCKFESEPDELFQATLTLPLINSVENASMRLWLIGVLKEKSQGFQGFLYLSKTPFLVDKMICTSNGVINIDETSEFFPPWSASSFTPPENLAEIHPERLLDIQCFTGCATCFNSQISGCITCNTGLYLFEHMCLSNCPNGTSPSSSDSRTICIKQTNMPIFWNFYRLTTIPEELTFINQGTPLTSAPWSANRGWFFNGQSYIKFKAMFSSFADFQFWVYPDSTLVVDNTPLLYFTNGRYSIDMMSGGTYSVQNFIPSAPIAWSQWSYIEVMHTYTFSNNNMIGRIVAYSNRNTGTGIVDMQRTNIKDCIFNDGTNYHDTFSDKYIGYNSNTNKFFTGYIFHFGHVRQRDTLSYYEFLNEDYTCITSDGYSPYPRASCLSTCLSPYKYYSPPSYCMSCAGPCPHGCIDSVPDCTIDCSANVNDCDVCTGKYICGVCKGDLIPFRGSCICPYTQTKTGTTCSCTGLKHDSVCVPNCPTGTIQSGSDCVADPTYPSSGLIFNLTLNQIKGTVYDSAGNSPILCGSTTSFYPNYDAYDPFPAYKRGYYFNGNSYMKLPPNDISSSNTLILPAAFTISAWFNHNLASTDYGTLLSKVSSQNNIGTNFWLGITNSRFVNFTMQVTIPNKGFYNLPFALNKYVDVQMWHHTSVTVFHDSMSTIVEIETDGIFKSHVRCLGLFVDTSNYQAYIGTHRGDNINVADYYNYKGFIYDLKIWNRVVDTTMDTSYSCDTSSCILYPSDRYVLPTETIDKFHNDTTGNSDSCPATCSTTGCRRVDSCNLCKVKNAISCDDWNTTKCKTDEFLYDDGKDLFCMNCADSCTSCALSPQCFDCTKVVTKVGTSCEEDSYGFQLSFENGKIYFDFAVELSFNIEIESIKVTSDDETEEYNTSGWSLHKVSNKQYYIDSDLTSDQFPINLDVNFEKSLN